MRDRQRRAAARHGVEADEIAREFRSITAMSGHNLHRLWSDWIDSMALAIANAVDHRPVRAEREAEYMRIVERQGAETMNRFAQMLGMVVHGLDIDQPIDLLGSIYMALEIGNDGTGQFFTPAGICELMAGLVMPAITVRETVERDGWITVHEPAIGGGATVIPMVGIVREAGLDPSRHLHVTGVDIDRTVLRMAYVQLSLLGVPAVLYVGDTLRMVLREDYYTPAHVLGGWGPRLRRKAGADVLQAVDDAREALVEVTAATEPTPVHAPVQLTLTGWPAD